MSFSAMENLIKGIVTALIPLQTSQEGAATWAPCNSTPPPYPASLGKELSIFIQPSGITNSLYDMFDQTYPTNSLATVLGAIIHEVIPSIAPNAGSDPSITTIKGDLQNPINPTISSND